MEFHTSIGTSVGLPTGDSIYNDQMHLILLKNKLSQLKQHRFAHMFSHKTTQNERDELLEGLMGTSLTRNQKGIFQKYGLLERLTNLDVNMKLFAQKNV